MQEIPENPLKADPKRFDVSRNTLLADAFMTQFIKVGGIGIILAVFGIFLFIFAEVVPLFRGATVTPVATIETGVKDFRLLGVDDWSEMPFVVDAKGDFHFVTLNVERDEEGHPVGAQPGERGEIHLSPTLPENASVQSVNYNHSKQSVLMGLDKGRGVVVSVNFEPEFALDGSRTINVSLDSSRIFDFGQTSGDVVGIDYFSTDRRGLAVGIIREGDSTSVRLARFSRRVSLFGAGKWTTNGTIDLTPQLNGNPVNALITGQGNALLVSLDSGDVAFFMLNGAEAELRQTFTPFTADEGGIASMNWLIGNETLILTSDKGVIRAFSPSVDLESGQRNYFHTKSFEPIPSGAELYSKSLRNRAFLLASGKHVTIRYATTENTRWSTELGFVPEAAILGNRYDSMLALDPDGRLHLFNVHDPHPEASVDAFFGKIWYEGQEGPDFIYQSSAGGAEVEPKFSMVNLIWGSLKGTIFAMVFAVPVALLAALYTSQFLKPEFKKVVKPTMEIMASLPSVVLGFLGALWLAPKIENDYPSIFVLMVMIPLSALAFGFAWSRLPQRARLMVKPGYEFLVFIPILIAVVLVGWSLGPSLESLCFVTTDPATGERIADFRLWWPQATGTPFDQRNALIVGFMMGFAVIPIIFTITEDALTNVPTFLTSASLALGASRWQTAWAVVLPTASAGIFSALMIGLGRAVGETMIVVMCSGNTPVFDFPIPNAFSGMRTLSANIAVELPEAPKGETHYRILFLGALLLFILTFVVNTAAEIARNRLRERYKTVG